MEKMTCLPLTAPASVSSDHYVFITAGEKSFLRKRDFYPNSSTNAWDGRYKGVDAPAGTYVYFAEMECNVGETFTRKGTVTLIR